MQAAQKAANSDQNDRIEKMRSLALLVTSIGNVSKELADYLDKADLSVNVTNLPESIHTPDMDKVCEEIRSLKQSLTSRPTEDKEVHTLLDKLLKAIDSLPKAFPEAPEPLEEVRVKNLTDYRASLKEILEAIKSLKLDVKPEITVRPADVHVDVENDYKALETQFKAILTAIKAIKLTVPENDQTPVIEAVKSVYEAIRDIRFPVPNFIATFKTYDGSAASAILDLQGAVVTAGASMSQRIDDGGTILYVGEAEIGALDSAAAWRIKKLDTTGGLTLLWADGDSNYDNVWDDRTTLNYS